VEISDAVNNGIDEVYDILEIAGVSDISDIYDTYDFTDTIDLVNYQYSEYVNDKTKDSTTTDDMVGITEETTAKNVLEFTVETPNETPENTKNTSTIPIAATGTAAAVATASAGGGVFIFRRKWFFKTKRK
jgi:methyl coenzyme M reductase alpha subunit